MNIYVESNFILELAFLQEQSHSCENILVLCQRKEARLIVPTFCLAEPFDTLGRKLKNRHNLTVTLDYEWKQLARSAQKETQINTLQGAVEVLFQNNREEPQRLYDVLEKIVKIAEIIPLVPDVVTAAAQIRTTTTLSLQDSMVYASVLHHLRTSAGSPHRNHQIMS